MSFYPPVTKKTVCGVMGVAAILFYFWLLTWSAPANAMSGVVQMPDASDGIVHQTKIFKRGRSPIYPYSAKGPGPKGWSSYIGFVPYTKGNVENEAIQRSQYPARTWPHDPNAPIPQPYGVN